jgi:long-chain fatty acid transport protein
MAQTAPPFEPRFPCKRAMGRALLVASGAAAVAAWAPSAQASGFAAARFGGELGGVMSTNPTALYYNPAGIGFSTGTSLFLDGSMAIRHFSWRHTLAPTDAPDPPGAEGANSGTASVTNVFGGPMLGATTRFGDLAIGASLEVPFGGRGGFGKNDKFTNSRFPLAADGIQRWHLIDGAVTHIYVTAGAAYRFGPLSIGVTGNLISSSVKNSQAKNFGDGYPNSGLEGRSSLDVSGWQGSFGLGAMWEAMPGKLWFGASYQAQPGLGPMKLKGSLDLVDEQQNPVHFPVTFDTALPDITRIGARFKASPTFELRLSGDLTRWSVMHTQCVGLDPHPCEVDAAGNATGEGGALQNIRRYWKDTWGVHVSASHWIKPEIEVYAGIAYETAASPDETLRPDLPDADNIAPAIGARLEVSKGFFVTGTYTHIQYFDRDNTGKSQLAQPNLPTRWPDGGGEYKQWIGVANLNIEKQF